jgi:hypothetical protein
MNQTKYRTDRDVRSTKPWFASLRGAPDWPDMRVVGLHYKRGTAHEDFTIDLVRAAAVTWLDELPGMCARSLHGTRTMGLHIPAGTPIYHLSAAEYAAAGFWTVE